MAEKPSNLKLRPALLNDLPEIQSLFVATIRHTCQSDYTPAQIAVWTRSVENEARWQTALREQYFLVAEVPGQIVGFGSLKNGNYLDFMYVHHDYQRRGVAGQLYQSLEAEARRQAVAVLTADVSKTARPFFEQRGFRVIRENKRMIREVEIINYRMSKSL